MANIKTLFKSDWLSLKKLDDWYEYTHGEKSNGQGIAVLIYREDNVKSIVGRYENTPCHFDGLTLSSLTGMVEKDMSPIDTAVKEIYEEAGIVCTKEELISLGTARTSKASDSIMHLYLLNAKNRPIGKSTSDGTKGEDDAYCKWVTYEEAIDCKCPLQAAMIKKAEVLGFNLSGDRDYILKHVIK